MTESRIQIPDKRTIGKRVKPVENPASCPKCGLSWDFVTDSIGRLVAIHGIGPCRPNPHLKPIAADDRYAWYDKRCEECGELFRPLKKAGTRKICSPECRHHRIERLRVERAKARGNDWKLSVRASLDLPTKECVECGRPFTQSSRLAGKQILCSLRCRKAREARKSKERAA